MKINTLFSDLGNVVIICSHVTNCHVSFKKCNSNFSIAHIFRSFPLDHLMPFPIDQACLPSFTPGLNHPFVYSTLAHFISHQHCPQCLQQQQGVMHLVLMTVLSGMKILGCAGPIHYSCILVSIGRWPDLYKILP